MAGTVPGVLTDVAAGVAAGAWAGQATAPSVFTGTVAHRRRDQEFLRAEMSSLFFLPEYPLSPISLARALRRATVQSS